MTAKRTDFMAKMKQVWRKSYLLISLFIWSVCCPIMDVTNLHWISLSILHCHLQQERTFSAKEAAPYVGEFQTDDVPTIRRVIIRHHDGKLQFYVDKFQFHLSHVSGLTFELIDRRKINCLPMVVMGVNHEKVHFHPPMTDYISPGFTVFGFNLQGKAYFYRKKTEEVSSSP